MNAELLTQVAAYCDAVPRGTTMVESVGPFELFVAPHDSWQYPARPAQGSSGWIVADIGKALSRQLQLDMHLQFAWRDEVSPELDAGRSLGVVEFDEDGVR